MEIEICIKTVSGENITVTVLGKYTPVRYGVRYTPNGDGYPDEPAEFAINKIIHKGIDITESLDKSGFEWNDLEVKILNMIEC